MRSNEHGRSMIEMLGVLAIVGVLSVGGIAGYSRAINKYKINTLTYQLSELIISIRTAYFQQNTFEDISVSTLINSNIAPHNLVSGRDTSSAQLIHAFNGTITIFPSLTETHEPKAFEIYINDIDRKACITIASFDWSQDITSGFLGLYIGTIPVNNAKMLEVTTSSPSKPENGIYTPGQHSLSVPISVAEAYAACSCSGATCSIGLKYM
ncbi:MAG: hypothetical protein J6W96_02520 [Alphaproteobacteria bacterium]|nr:hypothetical protein [Alphaproteobacteria bacterium]